MPRLLADSAAMVKRLLVRTARAVGVPPRKNMHHWGPGAAFYEARWALRIRRAPVMTASEHAASVAAGPRKHKEIEETIGCSLCGDQRMRPLFHAHDRKRKRPRWNYHVVRCESCGFLYRHPGIQPEHLGNLYSSGKYAQFLGGHYTAKRKRRYRLALDAFEPLFEDGGGRRLLDFGCGNGLFMEMAHERGFDVHGVDLAADAVEVARQRPGCEKAFHGSPMDVPEIAAGGFDVITMWSVLAHLPRPVEDLSMLRGLLAPDGVLLILTINANSLLLKRQLDAWGAFTPNHLKFFAPSTLQLLLQRAGFAAVAFSTMYGDAFEVGRTRLSPREQKRRRRAVERGNRANMMRAVGFADPGGPARAGFRREGIRTQVFE